MSIIQMMLMTAFSGFGVSGDPYFRYVSLLLTGEPNSWNSAVTSNTTFLDASTNAFTLTPSGTPTQGSFSPTAGEWSTYFNGATSLSSNAHSSLILGTGALTMEAWVYTSFASLGCVLSTIITGDGGLAFNINSTGKLQASGNTTGISTSTSSVPANTWTHVALTRNASSVWNFWINGVDAGGSVTNARNFTDNVGRVGVIVGTSSRFNGYISNARIVAGTALYTSTFTPPTGDLTAVSGTVLLTCNSNRHKDFSSNALTLTPAGAPAVSKYAPFNVSSEYSPSTYGSSVYTNATTDALTATGSGNINLSSGAFTIEAWIYPTASGSSQIICNKRTGSVDWQFALNTSNNIQFINLTTGSATATGALPVNCWTHVAVSASGSSYTIYVNGVASNISGQAYTITNNAANLVNVSYNSLPFKGFIADLRILQGTQLYTANFTPPSTPLTAITNTALLVKGANSGITDYSAKNNVLVAAGASLSSAQTKFGGNSISFNGTTGYLTVPPSPNNLFSRNFTIEAWVYCTASANAPDIISNYTSNIAADWILLMNAAGNSVQFYPAGSGSFISVGASLNVWMHIAVVRNNGTITIYRDGVAGQSVANTAAIGDSTRVVRIGSRNGSSGFFTGYIDDLRITNGRANYTTNFTPPTVANPTM